MLGKIKLLIIFFCCTLLICPPAEAATLIWGNGFNSGPQNTNAPANLVNSTAGVTITTSFQHNDDPGGNLISRVASNITLTGGSTAANGSTLTALIDGDNNTDALIVNFEFRNANNDLIPVEDTRFIIIDIDSDANPLPANPNIPPLANVTNRGWSDQVRFSGARNGIPVPPTLTPGTNGFTGLIPTVFPLSDPDLYSVELDLTNPNAPVAFGKRLNARNVASTSVAANQGDWWTANNDTNNGGVIASFSGVNSITSASFQYGYGPRAAGTANPGNQGVGFYNVFFTPVIIGVAKQASRVQANDDGTFTITYRILVRNYGETELRNVRVVENLVPTFGGAGNFTVTGVRRIDTTRAGAPAPNVNAGFNGNGDQEILDGAGTLLGRVLDGNNNELQPGGTVTVEFDVRVDPAVAGLGPFDNNVTAIGTSPNGTQVTDESTDGVNPDPGNDRGDSVLGNPASPAQPVSGAPDGSPVERVPTRVTLLNTATTTPLRVVKRITAVFRGGAELVRFNTFNDQPGTTADNDLNAAFVANAVANQPAGVFQVPANVTLQTGDQLEYTIYAWNPNAAQQLDAVSICDEVQAPTTLAAGTSDSTAVGNTNAAPAYPGVNALNVQERAGGATLDTSCLSFPGTFPAGGGIAVPAVPGFNLPAGQYATIRFRTTIP